jgi:hypothetical protein
MDWDMVLCDAKTTWEWRWDTLGTGKQDRPSMEGFIFLMLVPAVRCREILKLALIALY